MNNDYAKELAERELLINESINLLGKQNNELSIDDINRLKELWNRIKELNEIIEVFDSNNLESSAGYGHVGGLG